jgi:Big-like domain-containing protein/beta-propeller repeat-containing protein
MLRTHRLIAVAGTILLTAGCRDSLAPVPGPALDPTSGDIGRSLAGIAVSATNPALLYSTYLSGSGDDRGHGIAVDAAGNAYVTGFTNSINFPTTGGVFQPAVSVGQDVFVTKLDPTGSGLVYSTYLGGNNADQGLGIALDAGGNAYVTGFTQSTNFPTFAAFQTTLRGVADAFVTKLNPTGSGLVYSTYLGGSDNDQGFGIALDASPIPNAYVTGLTQSTNFPTTAGAFQTTFGGGTSDAFVTKLNPTGSGLVYSTYLGRSSSEQGRGIALDASPIPNAYVTGFTNSTNFPTTAGAFQTTFGGGISDAFVTKLNPLGTALVYSTYLGRSLEEQGLGIALDASPTPNAYVTGFTFSSNFPTVAAFQTTFGGVADAFVTKLNPTGSGLVYSTYLGGLTSDEGFDIGVDAVGNAYVTGFTQSTNFPTFAAFQTTFGGGVDAFVTKLNPTGSGLVYSTYLGGSSSEQGFGIALDPSPIPNAYVTGLTNSTDFPTTPGAFQTTSAGGIDAFVTKIGSVAAGPPATLELEPKAATNRVDTEHCVTATVRDASGNPVPDIIVRFEVRGAVNTSGSATTDENGQATFCYQGPPLPGADAITAFADTDDDQTQDADEPSDAATKTWILPPTTPLCEISISNGGRITAMNGDRATFGGNARSSQSGATQGQEEYQDHGPAQPLNMHSISVLAIVCDGPGQEASIYGDATIDGMGEYPYRIKVRDRGEPGVGRDTYWILLGNGYDSGDRTLEGGNVQIRR